MSLQTGYVCVIVQVVSPAVRQESAGRMTGCEATTWRALVQLILRGSFARRLHPAGTATYPPQDRYRLYTGADREVCRPRGQDPAGCRACVCRQQRTKKRSPQERRPSVWSLDILSGALISASRIRRVQNRTIRLRPSRRHSCGCKCPCYLRRRRWSHEA